MERLLPSCRRMARAASERLDSRPAITDVLGVGLHLAFCHNCRRYRRQVAWIRNAARSEAHGRALQDGLQSGLTGGRFAGWQRSRSAAAAGNRPPEPSASDPVPPSPGTE